MLYWLTQKLADVPEPDDWLSESEQALAASMRFPKRRNDWRLGRWAAKQAVCAYLGITPGLPRFAAMEIRAAPDGAPEPFLDDQRQPVSLSISHSAGVGFCVVGPSDSAVGCDLEIVHPLVDNLVEDYFVEEEATLLKQVCVQERTAFTLLIWSAKESALKSLREGLRRDTRSVIVSLQPMQRETGWNPLTVLCAESSHTFHGWWRIGGDYVRTITAGLPTKEPTEIQILT